ncbi:MAG TPA: hypothetical protein VGC59_15130, partial [Solirubrobacteraceae bacterium]
MDMGVVVNVDRVGMTIRIGPAHGNDVLLDIVLVRVMEVPVVQVVGVAVVHHRGVSAAGAVSVIMPFVDMGVKAHASTVRSMDAQSS